MNIRPDIVPLDAAEKLFALRDDKGNMIGTGTRETCEVLLYILQRCAAQPRAAGVRLSAVMTRPNVRSAITI